MKIEFKLLAYMWYGVGAFTAYWKLEMPMSLNLNILHNIDA